MPLLAPIFTGVYRYYLKLKTVAAGVIGIAQAGLELEFDFLNPRQFFEIEMTDPRGILQMSMTNPRGVAELDMEELTT